MSELEDGALCCFSVCGLGVLVLLALSSVLRVAEKHPPLPHQVAGVRPLHLLAFAATAGRGTGASGWNFRPLPCCPQGGSLGPAVLIRTATSTC